LHIGHLVPLERSNFAYVLGSSGEATHAHGGVGTFAKAMEFERLRGVWDPLTLPPSLRGGIQAFLRK
jgi:hypothetical protein